MSGSYSFLPFHLPVGVRPLSRFLPPLPDGLVSTWLKDNLPKNSLVLDPFGSQPRLAVEAARAGYRVLVTSNNPIERFLLELDARPPTLDELRAALADLSVSMKGDERIESHIRSLYSTSCANCGEKIPAEAYIWDREDNAIRERVYQCPHCDDKGSHPASQGDVDRAAQFKKSGLHWFRAIERVTPLDDPDRLHAEEALDTYTPRAVYALLTLINKLDRLSPARQRETRALLLTAFEQSNSLWSYSTARERPRQLKVSPHYIEKNIWQSLEEGARLWAEETTPAPHVSIAVWPNQPPATGGICLFPGPLRNLVERWESSESERLKVQAILAAIPRPNQAYWTLSALWAGWLWGQEATAPFKSVLRRHRYDWHWHCAALHAAFQSLGVLIERDTPFWASIGESEPGYLASTLVAAEMADFDLEGIALREEASQAQILWRYKSSKQELTSMPEIASSENLQHACQQVAAAHLQNRREPANYQQLLTATLTGLVQTWNLKLPLPPAPTEMLSLVQEAVHQAISDRKTFIRLGATERSYETGQWWLQPGSQIDYRGKEEIELSLSDRVEIAVIQYLQKSPGCTLDEVDYAVCQEFDGLFTPNRDLVDECLRSYGQSQEIDGERWFLRAQDDPVARRVDMNAVSRLVGQIGGYLGLKVIVANAEAETGTVQAPIRWLNLQEQIVYTFYILASAACSRLLTSQPPAASEEPSGEEEHRRRNIIVIPGGRSGLMLFKLEHNLLLSSSVKRDWRFVKYRLLHRLADNLSFDLNQLETLFDLDPLAYKDPQMPLI